MDKISKRRISFLFLFFAGFFLIVLGKAFKVQVIDRSELIAKSKSQIFRESKVYPKRGAIYDRAGNPLAINIRTYSIFTIPKLLKGDHSSYKKLVKAVPQFSYESIKKKIKNRRNYTWLARKMILTEKQVKTIKSLKGIYIEAVPKRLYPNHELLAQTIGFVGIDNNGLAGLEYQFNKKLQGKPRIIKYVKDAKGRAIKFEGKKVGNPSADITLTIDKDLQALAEKTLKDGVEKSKALRGGIGIMDATTGEILAMANYPTFDPNTYRKSKPNDRKLSFISDPFEPGSVFKTVTIASALENKLITPDTNYYCEQGQMKVEDHIINEAESHEKFEWLSVGEILKFSSNIGTTKIAFDLKYPKLEKTIKKFGFGQKTGINIPGESRGIFTEQVNVKPLSLSNISFGQGIATTGIQILSAYSSIANNGIYSKPKILLSEKVEQKRVLNEETAIEIKEMLSQAVSSGTGSNAKVKYYKIAGKTSTAQKPDKNGGYSGYIAGFVGFPMKVKKPFVIYVYVDQPKGRYYGNQIAAPIFKKVAEFILYKNKETSGMEFEKLAESKINFDVVNIKHSAPRLLKKGVVPNLIGLDKRSVKNTLEKLKIKSRHSGIGVVVKQEPVAFEKLQEGQIIKVYYQPPSYE